MATMQKMSIKNHKLAALKSARAPLCSKVKIRIARVVVPGAITNVEIIVSPMQKMKMTALQNAI